MSSAGSRAPVAILAALAACAGDEPTAVLRDRLADPSLLSLAAHGTWDEAGPDGARVVRAWVDAAVANRRYHKRVLVEVAAPYPAGWVRTLHPAAYEGGTGDGRERWGADTIEIFPTGGPDGGALAGAVVARVRLQHDADGDGTDEMVVTPWTALLGDDAGPPPAPPPDEPWLDLDSPVAADGSPLDVTFAPFDDPGRVILGEIDAVIARAHAAPGERHTIHAAVFNVHDDAIVDRLIAAHRAGVEVRVVFDGRKLRPWYAWYRGDDRLIAAGVPVLGAFRDGGAMHDKLAIFDGRRVVTGSFNWEPGARVENHEDLVRTGDPALVRAYAERFVALAGGPLAPRGAARDVRAAASVSFAPDEAPHRVLGALLDAAERRVLVAMFTCKDVPWDEDGRPTSLFAKLAAARARGVDVRVVVDHGVHEASEYHGVVSPDDPSDEWLEAQGIHVVRADDPRGPYASMHAKFAVIDDAIVVTGAFNWYWDAAYRNDEDQLVLRDAAVARRFTGELVALLAEYDPAFDPAEWPAVEVAFAVTHDRTRWGDQLVVVGDHPALGAWDPARGLPLDARAWPTWTGTVSVPLGTHLQWKVVTRHPGGSFGWEPGENRRSTAWAPGDRLELAVSAR